MACTITKAELELLDRSKEQWSVLVDRTESGSETPRLILRFCW
jgi:hypothetical protein